MKTRTLRHLLWSFTVALAAMGCERESRARPADTAPAAGEAAAATTTMVTDAFAVAMTGASTGRATGEADPWATVNANAGGHRPAGTGGERDPWAEPANPDGTRVEATGGSAGVATGTMAPAAPAADGTTAGVAVAGEPATTPEAGAELTDFDRLRNDFTAQLESRLRVIDARLADLRAGTNAVTPEVARALDAERTRLGTTLASARTQDEQGWTDFRRQVGASFDAFEAALADPSRVAAPAAGGAVATGSGSLNGAGTTDTTGSGSLNGTGSGTGTGTEPGTQTGTGTGTGDDGTAEAPPAILMPYVPTIPVVPAQPDTGTPTTNPGPPPSPGISPIEPGTLPPPTTNPGPPPAPAGTPGGT